MVMLDIHLAHTQGFCAGVSSAIEIVELAIAKYGVPLYVRHEIVHNTKIIQDFKKRGVIFIEDLADVPDNVPVVFSAHGTAPDVYEAAQKRGVHIIDATCPLVTKVHRQALRYSKRQIPTILIGHRGHQELIGTAGYVNDELLYIVETEDDIAEIKLDADTELGILTQTTLSVSDTADLISAIKKRFPNVITGNKEDICYATQNRQDAVQELAEFCELIIICGSPNSSNSNRLRECAASAGRESIIIDSKQELDWSLLEGKTCIGISSGASVPSEIVDDLVRDIQTRYPDSKLHQKDSIEKGILFPLPEEMAQFKASRKKLE